MTTLPLNRETVARIIDPRAFMAWEGREPEPKHHAAVERALAKADAILALEDGEPVACSVAFGSHETAVEMVPPPHMAREDGRGICIDACLALEVSRLWKMGIATTGCCCGHGRQPGFIGVIDKDISRMAELGYSPVFNPHRPKDGDSFSPKSQCRTRPSSVEGGVLERVEAWIVREEQAAGTVQGPAFKGSEWGADIIERHRQNAADLRALLTASRSAGKE